MLRKAKVLLKIVVCCSVVCSKPAWSWAAPASFSFQAGQGGWQLGTLAVGNIDDDPVLEIIVPYRDTTGTRSAWHLDAFKPDGQRIKGFPYQGGNEPINVSPTLYDLDGDGRAEILFTRGSNIVALRGDGTVLWSTPITWQNYVPDAGYQAVTNGFYWSADGQWRDRLPETAQFFSEVSPPIVADANGNGSLQVMTAWKVLPDSTSHDQDFNPFIKALFGFGDWGTVGDVWSGGVIFCDALSGSKDFIYHIHQLIESGLAVGQARPGEGPLVYVLNDSDSVVAFDKTKPYGLWGKGMLYKKFGKNQRLQSGSYLKPVDVYPVDLDGDGEEELSVPTTQLDPLWQPSETILDDDGAIVWRQWKEPVDLSVAKGWLNSACMIPVNPDHDNHVDVLSFTHSHQIWFRSWNGIELVDRAGWPKDFSPLVPTPPVVGDVDGDGEEEIVIGTYDATGTTSSGKLYIFALDGAEKFGLDVPGGIKHIPSLADVYGDGGLEVIYRALDGKVYVQNFGANHPTSVSWATHRGNMRRDGNRGVSLFPKGTPVVTQKESGYRRSSFSWRIPEGELPRQIVIARAEQPEGPFQSVAQLDRATSSYTDVGLRDGVQYLYEVRAVYDRGTVASSPFAILSLFNNNLVANAGFEENDNSHWDKWFTGDIPWQQMVGSRDQPFQGKQCMEIKLVNNTDSSSIKQSNQYGIPDPAIRTEAGKLYSFGGWLRSGGISQPSAHWLEWNTSHTGDNTKQIPPAPWPVYFTPHFRIGTESTPWTYLNRVFVMPDGFPTVELRHRYTISGSGSGSLFIDNVFFRELPALTDIRWQELLPFGSRWRYKVGDAPSDWASASFDDSSWTDAPAKFGGGTGTTEIVTRLPLMQRAYFFRRTFTVTAADFQEFLLAARATDDFNGQTYPLRVYLNGQELGSLGIDAVSGTGSITKWFDLLPFADLVQPGTNTIAVEVQNGWAADWDNVAFDLSLRAVPAASSSEAAKFTSIQSDGNGTVTLRINGPAGSSWQVESADSPVGTWQTVQTLTIKSGAGTVITDSTGTRARFYRIVPQ